MEDIQEIRNTEEVQKSEETKQPQPEKIPEAAPGKESNDLLVFVGEQRAHNQKMQRMMKIAAGCMIGIFAVVVLVAALILPPVLGILSDAQEITTQVQDITGQAQEVLTQAQQVVNQVKEGDPKKLMDNLNSLAVEGEGAMQDCVEQITRAVDILDKMDIESLNTAVDNLGKAIAPLAKLFGGR